MATLSFHRKPPIAVGRQTQLIPVNDTQLTLVHTSGHIASNSTNEYIQHLYRKILRERDMGTQQLTSTVVMKAPRLGGERNPRQANTVRRRGCIVVYLRGNRY